MLMVGIGGTLWLLISLAFILNSLNAPRFLLRATMGLLALEFVVLVVPFGAVQCGGGPCINGRGYGNAWADLLTYGMPSVAVGFTIGVIVYGLLRHRGAES